MPPKKNPVKTLKSAITDHNNQVNKCQVIIHSNKLDKYSPIQSKLEDKFDALCQAWESYKEDVFEKGNTEENFNAEKEDGTGPLFVYNDG